MAQRMLAQWQQHSAEETIYITLCVHTGMSVWLRLNKREAVRKRGILCLSIIVCSLCLTHKKLPLLLFHILVQAIPLPISFFFILPVGSSHGTRSPEFLFRVVPWPSHFPFCSRFLSRTQSPQDYLLSNQAATWRDTSWKPILRYVANLLTTRALGVQ